MKVSLWTVFQIVTITLLSINSIIYRMGIEAFTQTDSESFCQALIGLNTGKYGPGKTSRGYDQKRKLFRTNNFVLAHSSDQRKSLHKTTNVKVFNTMVSLDFNMTSFSPCCHNWLACICFSVCICLLSRIFCLATDQEKLSIWTLFTQCKYKY